MQTYAQRVADAVNDVEWQTFRKSMKGKSTKDKLKMLGDYYDAHANGTQGEYDFVVIRIDNYIKALCRGGQLEAGMSFDHFNDGCIYDHIRK